MKHKIGVGLEKSGFAHKGATRGS